MTFATKQATPSLTVYGIPNCDTVKKARAWLDGRGTLYTFHDFKKQGVPADLVPEWVRQIGVERLINRRGPTWRGLDAALQASVVDTESALRVMQTHSSVIKRPVVAWPDGVVTVGFDEAAFEARLTAQRPR
jgi:Spx/MgsR family transcriptional regulator